MKQLDQISGKFLVILAATVFFHYFVLTNFSVGSADRFVGQVTEVREVRQGLYPSVEVNFEVAQLVNGSMVKTNKIIKTVRSSAKQFEVGQTYTVKTIKDWICSFSKT